MYKYFLWLNAILFYGYIPHFVSIISYMDFFYFLAIINNVATNTHVHTFWWRHMFSILLCIRGIQPCNMKNRDIYWRIYKIQETLYIGHWCFSPLQRRHLRTSLSSLNHRHLPCCIFLNLMDSLKSLPFLRWFQF